MRIGVVLFVLGKQVSWLSVPLYNRTRAFSTAVLPVPAFSPQTERGISSGQGARGPADARIMSAPRALAFAAEELLQELVEEHRDTAIEFRSLTGSAPRRGRWVGGDTPIEDAKTKKRFRMLDPWCAQVRLR